MIPENSVLVLFARLNGRANADHYAHYLKLFPASLQEQINRYVQPHDRLMGIAGKVLLLRCLARAGIAISHLQSYSNGAFNRPHLASLPNIDFNISHADDIAACALAGSGGVGLDIEKIRPVNLLNFVSHFSRDQWDEVEAAPDPADVFFRYWAQKEAVIKADTTIFTTPFADIHIEHQRAFAGGKHWHLSALQIHPEYSAWLATDRPVNVVMSEVPL